MIIDYEEHDKIVDMYDTEMMAMQEIADRYGVTRQCIKKILGQYDVDTSKTRVWIKNCSTCGKQFSRTRKRIRKQRNHFCCMECYNVFRRTEGSIRWRQGQRIAEEVVSRYFFLEKGHIIHHEDHNNRNNDPKNLKIFASHSDHMRYHHAQWAGVEQEVVPLWEGSILTLTRKKKLIRKPYVCIHPEIES